MGIVGASPHVFYLVGLMMARDVFVRIQENCNGKLVFLLQGAPLMFQPHFAEKPCWPVNGPTEGYIRGLTHQIKPRVPTLHGRRTLWAPMGRTMDDICGLAY